MKWIVGLIMAVALAGCGEQTNKGPKLQENTEEYISAHGIVPGQINELLIGGTLFRFPAGVGLNPYTAQEAIRTNDGSPMTLASKECLEQGKCERVATPIVKGRADKVTFFLDSKRNFAPGSDPFQSGDVRVKISKYGAPAYPDLFEKSIRDKSIVIEHPEFGLREYRSEKYWIGSIYESALPQLQQAADGGKLFFGCQPSQLPMSGLCGASYWRDDGKYSVAIGMDKPLFLKHWQESYAAAVRFIDSAVVK
ncbi:MAG: hypothetical protein Q8K57_18385 [Thiobacillus sp.]|nr:hypothetical protein [Thiobacillus sp.]MDP1926743.1 hypothetical protein [Thiobacillus sp.]